MIPLKRIAVTVGEPGGVGPDLILNLAQRPFPGEVVVFGCPKNLHYRAKVLNLPIKFVEADFLQPPQQNGNGLIRLYPIPLPKPQVLGYADNVNRLQVLESLKTAFSFCMEGLTQAIVTGPVQKSALNTLTEPFYGHTEFFADLAQTKNILMAFYHPKCIVGLLTTHIPLKLVPERITQERLTQAIHLLNTYLNRWFSRPSPRIIVLGLNPHAGEQGLFGTEEIEIIAPVIYDLQQQGINVHGPVSADTAFTPNTLDQADAILALYHDQGLTPLKSFGFGNIVNITMGLPILRASVDHGTAFALAGTKHVDTASFSSALQLAFALINQQEMHLCHPKNI
ncbi:MAG TPA: 4-hydroxythreonine-4-phosphate dehydrogenase PdxA [Gammaproteobacteria bacterium]|nr:4-hydroxythreonine-4-phosphate dehydrogenase PdxA [Gammaproteobacteria bacterium]